MAAIRRLRRDEWRSLRALRLAALAESPEAFGRTLAEERLFDDGTWQEMATGVVYVAIEGDDPVAMAGAYDASDRALGIWGMWVAPDHRRRGLGRALLDVLVGWGRDQGFESALLDVTETNAPGYELYRSSGFVPTGATRPLRPGSSTTVVEMRCTLT